MCGTQPPAQSVHLPAIHWFLSNKTADKHSRASSGTEPCHWQEGEINEHPRGNQVWSCLFPKTCKNLGAGWLWMLDKASTWSAHSGKLLGPADRLLVVIHHHIFHGSEDKVSFWRFLKVKGLCRKTVISNGSKCNLKLWVFYFFWGLEPFAFPPFFLQKIPLVTHIPSYWEAGRCPKCSPTSRAAPTSLPSGGWVLLLWLLGRGRFVSRAELWASCPAAASASGAPPTMTPKVM